MTKNQHLAGFTAAMFALFFIIIGVVSYAAGGSNARAAAPTYIDHVLYTCETERVAEDIGDGVYGPGIGPDLAALLIDAGWQGYQGDGMEKIYSPACRVFVAEDGTVTVKDTDGKVVR